MDRIIYGHSIIKKVLSSLDIKQSVNESTSIRGHSIPSTGYRFDSYSQNNLSFNGLSRASFDEVVEKLKESGIKIEDFQEPSKVIRQGSHSFILLEKVYDFK